MGKFFAKSRQNAVMETSASRQKAVFELRTFNIQFPTSNSNGAYTPIDEALGFEDTVETLQCGS
jgi:hypothetical protein